MSSVLSSTANVKQGSAFFVVVVQALAEDVLTATGAPLTNAGLLARLAPGAVVRDLGKTVRFPGTAGGGSTQEVLRAVQLVDTGALSPLVDGLPTTFVNYNEGVGNFPTFYLRIRPSTVTGGNPIIASLTV
jgi:hypothetical protein